LKAVERRHPSFVNQVISASLACSGFSALLVSINNPGAIIRRVTFFGTIENLVGNGIGSNEQPSAAN
jgi:hypothetical protein